MNKQLSHVKPGQCPGFEGCKAPICPLDASFLKATWFPNEPICQGRAYRRERWRKVQVRISRTAKDHETCYTAAMLSAVRQVRGGIMGLNPEDVVNPERLNAWVKQRSERGSFNQKGVESAINKKLDTHVPMFGGIRKRRQLV